MSETNRKLAEAVVGCWHDIGGRAHSGFGDTCDKCGNHLEYNWRNPSYDTDLNLIREVEVFVIEKIGPQDYGWQLRQIMREQLIGDLDANVAIVATATAHQRSIACLRALGLEN